MKVNHKISHWFMAGIVAVGGLAQACQGAGEAEDGALLQAVSFEKVALCDSFWLPRLEIQKNTLVPFALGKVEPAVENLRRTAAYLKQGKEERLLDLPRYVDSDLFKVMEGAAYLLALRRDAVLERQMDSIIDLIAGAQCEDGYLYEQLSVPPSMTDRKWGTGDKPYSFVVHSHELYNMGHMYEGAVAYYKATGKRNWLDVAEKNAQHLYRVFVEGDPRYNEGKPVNQAPGHEEIELALVKLYEVTGCRTYLDLAKHLIDVRGVTYVPEGEGVMSPSYAQQHLPVRQQREAEGHSVRAMYLYSGVADVMAKTGDITLSPMLQAVWHDIVDKKMHINGGLGAVPGIEGFGPAYELPNKNTYDETCAAVSNVLFNYRMFLAYKEAKYVDVAEVALYNNVLAGVNLEGNRFFYVNVLEADGKKNFNLGRAGRSPWFNTACCPSNLARLIPQVPGMIYSHTEDAIYCGLYVGNETEIPLAAGSVALKQRTDYPFDGKISIEVNPSVEQSEFTLYLRIPTWCRDRFVPGELYHYVEQPQQQPVLKVGGKEVKMKMDKGYVAVRRAWRKGDQVELQLPMPVCYTVADARVEADMNRMCVTRGPLVYCAESPDNRFKPTGCILPASDAHSVVRTVNEGILKGIATISLHGAALDEEGHEQAADWTLIPYYAWNNRGDNSVMNVWMARDAATAASGLTSVVGNVADVTASYTNGSDEVVAIADGKTPKHSADGSIPRWTSWPKKGISQQVEVKLKAMQALGSVSVYWYDDQGGVQRPASWTMEYHAADGWHDFPLYVTDMYSVEADRYNVVHPARPVQADAVRLHVTPRRDAAVGILEVVVE